ncbi:MAG: NAD(P)H-dependent glycerol-3-phosphate dehydrogenase [Ruminococcaceae bacterium]|nr:NAD(P)H-dependent glycerol-3-phosphate dehydrogenase [Oscillospiraceae bacterium]
MKSIAVIGSGGWGTAIASLLAKNGHEVALWSYLPAESEALSRDKENKQFLPGVKLPESIRFTASLEEAAQGAEILFMVTPSKAVAATAKALSPFVAEGTVIVNASKGLEQATQRRLSEVIAEAVPQARIAVMSGPSHAEEVGRGLPTTNVIASADLQLSQELQDVLMSDSFRVYTGTDMVGVELGGALKNVIALCAGVADGLGLGDNAKAALMTRGIAEIARLGVAMGADLSTFSGLSGVGDLIVTCTSMHSRNRRAGILIGQGVSPEKAVEEVKMVVEGFYTTKAAYKLATRLGVEMPITEQAYQVLFEGKDPKTAVMSLMVRKKKHETEREAIDGIF